MEFTLLNLLLVLSQVGSRPATRPETRVAATRPERWVGSGQRPGALTHPTRDPTRPGPPGRVGQNPSTRPTSDPTRPASDPTRPDPEQHYLLLFLPAVALCHKFLYRSTRRSLPLPPGPPKKPLIGNLLDLPANQQWLTFAKWSKEYDSDIIHVSALGTSIVVLSSPEAVKELFEKRSAVYSSRVQAPMVNELMGWGGFIGFLPYGARWRSHRKAFMQAFNPEVVKQFYSQQRNGVHSLLRRILAQPNDDVIGQFWIFAAGIQAIPVLY
ncbi:unnamed protein product [Mycena citricolor]|uniref:Cytochrome P450 n=1 Tax=Mycena citricolor TaxID=2018698 RepID=A0AAD2HZL0_9AGAR|nr:unnamed protein product [Mycena citricolor]